ncbi:COG3650 family protein [Paracoccus spongiarum]|uniref:SH3 domain-containing protein n=1 Tax=Paracoccus spongiarum TaxID=3064387 RepID=A0ABT9JAX9_9RHOB|nr:SH3 domain-containing protein [Paracoccus sp. 2205BS29-5]MDP5306963.1 SH3 domain-containing protein [Paracoccus sp. 2205BS29-5]
MLRAMIAVLLLAGPAAATQEYILPTLFDVTDVASDDVLNIRSEPHAGSPVIGSLAADAARIEVVEERDGWARVNTGEGSSWASMRFLSPRSDTWQEGALPQGFSCFGTEPFWDLQAEGDSLVLRSPDNPDDARPRQAVLGSGIFRDPMRAVLGRDLTLVAVPQLCSDGMSDRLFGLRATLVLQDGTPRLLSGCCSIAP